MFAKLSSSTDVSENSSARLDEDELSPKQKLTRMFLASSCKLNEAKLKLREKEEQLRQIGSEHLAKVNKQSEVGTSCPDENQQVNSSVSSTTAVHVSS